MMEFREQIVRWTVIFTCVTVCTGFVLVKSDVHEDDKSVENRITYLIDLLKQLKQITEPEYDSDDVTSFDDFTANNIPTEDNQSRGIVQPVDDTYARFIDIRKKDFAILPPANEWCRMMGFRRCRQNHS